jgi:cytochrome c-type biogenesis protein CcmH
VTASRRIVLAAAGAGLAGWLSGGAALADETPASDDLPEADQGFVPGADRLEGRILAPCCWTQTIDIHGSEIAMALRREIRRRLRAGETPEAIEQSLVDRYGERILAVRPGSPLKSMAAGLATAFGVGGVGAVTLLVRWRKRGAARRATQVPAPERAAPASELDRRLEAELARLDDDA